MTNIRNFSRRRDKTFYPNGISLTIFLFFDKKLTYLNCKLYQWETEKQKIWFFFKNAYKTLVSLPFTDSENGLFRYYPGRNISQIFFEIFCRFWDIYEKVGDFSEALIFYSLSELLPNSFFKFSAFSSSLYKFSLIFKYLTSWHFVKQKMRISEISPKLLFFKFFGISRRIFWVFSIFSKLLCPQFCWIQRK